MQVAGKKALRQEESLKTEEGRKGTQRGAVILTTEWSKVENQVTMWEGRRK